MKIAVAFPGCHRRGGVERVVFECARHLAGQGHEVSLFASEWDEAPAAEIDMVKIPRATHAPAFLQGAFFQRSCAAALEGRRFDVLNTHGCVCPFDGVYWVQSVHAAWLEKADSFRRKGSLAWWKQRANPAHPLLLHLERRHFSQRRYRHLIATTPQVKQDLQRLYQVPANDVTIVPNGFCPAEFNPERCHERRKIAREQLKLREDDVAFLFAANELDRKGYGTLVAALSSLPDPRIKVVAVGRYNVREATRRAAAAGVAERIVFRPASSDIAWFHSACDVFVLPTQYEAFSLAILEALGSGLPVITSGVPGARDAIQEGANGLLVEAPDDWQSLRDSMIRLSEPGLRSRLSLQASNSVTKYQWPRIMSQYEEILETHSAPSVRTRQPYPDLL